ncbi:MAG: hypothetical protein HY821_09160 [Acidobacteria bacterium]|nr:hypothetical protein [Acidobacteriota bacterium]
MPRTFMIAAALLTCLLTPGAVLFGQAEMEHKGMGMMVVSTKEPVELKGTIERIQIVPGQGMPLLEVKDEKGTTRVFLGSMRYLMEKNFNPKSGEKVVVKGFRSGQDVYARTVELPGAKQTIELRGEDGVPLWRMGRYGSPKK